MKNVDELITSAAELAGCGLWKVEIADELNVSRETASWIVDRVDTPGAEGVQTGAEPTSTSDIRVGWSANGRDSSRLVYAANEVADLVTAENGDTIDLTVGIEKAGVPLATAIRRALDTDITIYAGNVQIRMNSGAARISAQLVNSRNTPSHFILI